MIQNRTRSDRSNFLFLNFIILHRSYFFLFARERLLTNSVKMTCIRWKKQVLEIYEVGHILEKYR